MNIADVKKLSPTDRFLYWIKERHQVYLRRRTGKDKPWTDDEIIQTNFFTNPYRENDKVTVWFRENIREPLRNLHEVILATIIFRWFNLPATGAVLANSTHHGDAYDYGLLTGWDSKVALRKLGAIRDKGEQIFTGAFMINSPGGEPKLEAICRRIDKVWKDRDQLIGHLTDLRNHGGEPCTLQAAHKALTQYEGLGGFMAYEVVCDLRYTYVLENAPDKLTWSNPGPGAIRGLYRILEIPFDAANNSSSPPCPKDYQEQTAKLLKTVQRRLPKMPPFEMREIEHSLCEFDKYSRLLFGEGRGKRKYEGRW